jgi:hypothetical protein
MKKINIAELLKDCPSGMELDCTMYEDCKFLDVDINTINNSYLIRITTPCGIKYLDAYGRYNADDKAKCVIFPKGKTTWEGFVKKKPQYPKTYCECCEVLMGKTDFQDYSLVLTKLSTNKNEENSISPEPPHITLINNYYKLLICRDAYMKIAGQQMGLGKPWEPTMETVYCISRNDNVIKCSYRGGKSNVLEFPTEEMCNIFYENFKDLIEECKELL